MKVVLPNPGPRRCRDDPIAWASKQAECGSRKERTIFPGLVGNVLLSGLFMFVPLAQSRIKVNSGSVSLPRYRFSEEPHQDPDRTKPSPSRNT